MFTGICVISGVVIGLSNCGCTFGVAIAGGCIGYTLGNIFSKVDKKFKSRF